MANKPKIYLDGTEKKPIEVPGNDIRVGHPKYDGFMREWIHEGKPSILEYAGGHFMVFQDSEDQNMVFRVASQGGLYGSKSF